MARLLTGPTGTPIMDVALRSIIGDAEMIVSGMAYLSVSVDATDDTISTISDLSPYAFRALTPGLTNYGLRRHYDISDIDPPPGTITYQEGANVYVSAGGVFSYSLNEYANPPKLSAKPPGVGAAWNPRAVSRAYSSDPSTVYAGAWKIRIYGHVWGVLCQYAAKAYGDGGGGYSDGPTDAVMVDETPSSYQTIDCPVGQSFEFKANDTPNPATTENPDGEPAIAIFWSGYELADFSWYP